MEKAKRENRPFFFIALFLFTGNLSSHGASSPSPLIRVMILSDASRVEAGATGSFRIRHLSSARERSFLSPQTPVIMKPSQEGIQILDEIWGRQVLIEGKDSASFIRINNRRYRGQIIVEEKNSLLRLVNRLPLEEYLWGVIKMEISPKWPSASILAFTIAARTYALKRMQDPSTDAAGYDVSGEQDHQVYRGAEAEDLTVRKLVQETRGKILTYLGETIEASHHACSGGYTASSEDIWGEEGYPYLVAKPDRFCEDSPYFNWKYRIRTEELRNLLAKKKGEVLGRLYWIRPLELSQGGRVKTLAIGYQGMKEPYKIEGKKLREIVGVNDLRSTLFTVKRFGPTFVFEGNGWGHGVGLCQEGARVMGERGYTYQEILEFYYPGTTIENVY